MPHAAVVVGALLRRRWRLVALVALLGAGLAALALQQLHVAQSSSSSSGNGRYGIPLLRRHRPATAALAAPTALPRHVVVVHTHPATGQQGSDARLDQVVEELAALGHHVTFLYARTESGFSSGGGSRLLGRHRRYFQLGAQQVRGSLPSYSAAVLAAIACPAGTIADAPPGTSDRSEVCGCPAPVVLQWPWPSSTYERWLEKLDQALFRSLPGTYLATVFDNDMQQRKMDENRALHQMTGGGAPPSHSEKLQPLGSSIANMLHMSHEVLGITNASLEAVRREPELSQKFNNNMHLLPYEVATPEVADATHNSFADSDVPFLYMAGFSPANVASLRWLCTTFVPALAAFGQGYQLHILGSISSGKDTYCADCGNTCVFHGFVPDNEMDNLLRRTRVFIAPIMVHTGISTKVVQALARHTPVVTTPLGLMATPKEMENMPLVVPLESLASQALKIASSAEAWTSVASRRPQHAPSRTAEYLNAIVMRSQAMGAPCAQYQHIPLFSLSLTSVCQRADANTVHTRLMCNRMCKATFAGMEDRLPGALARGKHAKLTHSVTCTNTVPTQRPAGCTKGKCLSVCYMITEAVDILVSAHRSEACDRIWLPTDNLALALTAALPNDAPTRFAVVLQSLPPQPTCDSALSYVADRLPSARNDASSLRLLFVVDCNVQEWWRRVTSVLQAASVGKLTHSVASIVLVLFGTKEDSECLSMGAGLGKASGWHGVDITVLKVGDLQNGHPGAHDFVFHVLDANEKGLRCAPVLSAVACGAFPFAAGSESACKDVIPDEIRFASPTLASLFRDPARRKSKMEFFGPTLAEQYSPQQQALSLHALLEWPDIYGKFHGVDMVKTAFRESL